MVTIRKVIEEDNAALAKAIRQVLIDIGVPKVGTAYADPELDFMYQAYQTTRSAYFVIEEDEIKTKKPAQKLINATNQFINRSVQVPEWGTIFLEAADFSVRLEKDISKYLIKDIKSGISIH